MHRAAAALLALALLSLLSVSCDKGTPIAPSGGVLRVTVTPDRILADGEATVRAEVLRANGNPVSSGTEVRFSTNLGNVTPGIAYTDANGIALASFRGDGRIGTAKVIARSGSLEATSDDIKVGSFPSSISLLATPSSVPETGGEIELLVLVRDDQGNPLAGTNVNFAAYKGTLESGGRFLATNSAGEATDLLEVTAADISTISGDSFTVRVEASGSSVLSQSRTISIQRAPRANFTFARSLLTVVFTDTSTGNPTDWFWQFGDPGNNTSRQQNPSFTYPAPGTYLVRLRASNATGASEAAQFVAVTGN